MKIFSIDFRSLALFRIALGLVVLYSLGTLAVVADMFLARDGVISQEAIRYYHRGTWTWSVNWLSDATWFQYGVLLLAAVAAVCLVLGWRTRLFTVLTWALLSSIHMRVTPIFGGGDILLNLLLFWAMFLPLGARWSIDAKRQTESPDESIVSVGTVAIFLQMAMMYFFTGISKFNDVWFSGSALGIGLSIDRVTRPLGHVLAGYPGATSLISRGTLAAELTLPFLLFSPWKSKWCRSIGLLMLIGFHIGIEATMVVAMFSYASLAGLTLFVPSAWWQYPPLKQVQNLLDTLFGVQPSPKPSKHASEKKKRRGRRASRGGVNLKQRLVQAAVVVCILYVFLYNVIVSFASDDFKRSLGSFQRVGELLVLKQYWDMFSDPSPNCNDVACVARLRDGTQIDLLRENSTVNDRTTRPARAAQYDRSRKMVFASVLAHPNSEVFDEDYLRYLCRKYEETNSDPQKKIVECYLMYYPYGAHPYANRTSFIELMHVRPNG